MLKNSALASKYGFYAGATRLLTGVAYAATGLEVMAAGYQVYEAPEGQKLDVGVHETGEIGSAWMGRTVGAAGAESTLITVGAALELEPGPGTLLGTAILGGTVGGFGLMRFYEHSIEPTVISHVNEYRSDIKTGLGW